MTITQREMMVRMKKPRMTSRLLQIRPQLTRISTIQ